MKPRALLYARVSTADKGQDWHAQLEELQVVAAQRGWEIVAQFHDTTSGAKSDRPGLAAAVALCRRGGADIFAAVSTCRFARSTINLLQLVDELEACGVKVSATREGVLDGTTPNGRAFLTVRGAFAELERRVRAEQIREALAVRRMRGQRLGRAPSGQYTDGDQVRKPRARGVPWSKVIAKHGGTNWGWARALERTAA